MYQQNKITAFLLSAVLLTGSVLTDKSQLQLQYSKSELSVSEFAELLQKKLPTEKKPFAELRFSKAHNMLKCDGESVGLHYGKWNARNGELKVETETGELSLNEAVNQLGCEVSEDKETGEVVVHSPFQNGRLIVKSEHPVKAYGGDELASGYENLHVLQYDTTQEAYQAYQKFQDNPKIEYVCPDSYFHCDDTVTNGISYPADADIWGVERIASADYCEWLKAEKTELPEVTVAVIDTGINSGHTWFKDRIAEGGKSMCTTESGNYEDGNGHGTHCAGIVCQVTPDNVKIMPIRVLNEKGIGSNLDVYCGMMYALEMGVDVVSLSLGSQGYCPLMADASKKLADADIPCCVAAGNESENSMYHSPANCTENITVAASDGENPTTFSNYGEDVDFCAPGLSIYSAYIGSQNATVYMSGTSMATPFVAGAVADLLSYDKTFTTEQIYNYLKINAIDLSPDGFDMTNGWGHIYLGDFSFKEQSVAEPSIINIDSSEMYFDETMQKYIRYNVFTMPFHVTLGCATENAKIYYTLDDTTPSEENGTLYTEPILIEHSAILQAVAIKNHRRSAVLSERFNFFNSDIEIADPYTVKDGVLIRYNGYAATVDLAADFPDGSLKEIGDSAFRGTEVRIVTLPDSVKKIGDHAFQDIPTLNEIYANGVEEIGEEAFCNSFALWIGRFGMLRKIGRAAFLDASGGLSFKGISSEITEIPEDAFHGDDNSQISFTGESMDWSNIRKIGARGFYNTNFLFDDLSFPALESLGEAAFAYVKCHSLQLPSTITTLPNQVFANAYIEDSLTAHSVTKIGDSAFESVNITESTYYDRPNLLLNYANITEIGAYGMADVGFTQPISFDSLTYVGSNAFCGAVGEMILLPLLTEITTDALNGAKMLIYTPNLEVLTDENDSDVPSVQTYALAVGELLNDIRLTKSFIAEYLAGPDESKLADYAKRKDIPYHPYSLYPMEYGTDANTTQIIKISAQQYTTRAFSAERIRTDESDAAWYLVKNDVETPLLNLNGFSITYFFEEAGDYTLRAVSYQGTERKKQLDYQIHVSETQLLTMNDMESDGKTLFLDWDKLTADHSDYEMAPNNGYPKSFALQFVADVADSYTITTDYRLSSAIAVNAQTWESKEIESMTAMLATHQHTEMNLNQGDTLYIFLSVTQPSDLSSLRILGQKQGTVTFINDFTVKEIDSEQYWITENSTILSYPSYQLSGEQMSYFDYLMNNENNKQIVDFNDEDYREQLSVAGDYCTLIPYPLSYHLYSRNFSFQFPSYPVCGAISDDSSVSLNHSKAGEQRYAYRFVPEENEIYHFNTEYASSALAEEAKCGQFRKTFWQNAALTLCDENGHKISDSIAPYGLAALSAELEKEKTYYILVESAADGLELNVTHGDVHSLAENAEIRITGDLIWNGTQNHPTIELYKVENRISPDDYTVTYFGGDSLGNVGIYAAGSNGWKGAVFTVVSLGIALSEDTPATLCPKNTEDFSVFFTAEEDGEYCFALHCAEEVQYSDDFESMKRITMQDSVSGNIVQSNALAVTLEAGESCCVTIQNVSCDVEVEAARNKKPLQMRYVKETGYVLTNLRLYIPQYSVVDFDGNVLQKDVDYKQSFCFPDNANSVYLKLTGIGNYYGEYLQKTDGIESIVSNEKKDCNGVSEYFFVPQTTEIYNLYVSQLSNSVCRELENKTFIWDQYMKGIECELAVYDSQDNKLIQQSVSSTDQQILRIELNAGETYHIVASSNKESSPFSLYLYPSDDMKTIQEYNIEWTTVDYKNAEYEIEVYYDMFEEGKDPERILLNENEDYTVRYFDDTNKYCVYAVVQGIGAYSLMQVSTKYYGEMVEGERRSRMIDVDEIVYWEENCHYILNIPFECKLSFEVLSGKMSTDLFTDQNLPEDFEGTQYDTIIEDKRSAEEQIREKNVFCFRLAEAPIDYADVTVSDCIYTGKTVKPEVTVTMGDYELCEGVDYEIVFPSKPVNRGNYKIQIIGKGAFSGDTSASFRVISPELDSEPDLLTEGTHTAEISIDKQQVLYRWIPDKDKYYFLNEQYLNTNITVYDENIRELTSIEGAFIGYDEMTVEPGNLYYVGVSFVNQYESGDLSFTLATEHRLLDDCTLNLNPQAVMQNGKAVPEFTVCDGDTTLTEGEDYEIWLGASSTYFGRVEFTLRGKGKYIGYLSDYYYVIPQTVDEMYKPLGTPPKTIQMEQDIEYPNYECPFCSYSLYTFTADADAEYQITQPDHEETNICTVVYAADGNSLPIGTDIVTLAAGETISILCIVDYELVYDISGLEIRNLKISVNQESYLLTVDGLTYRIEPDGAVLAAIDTNAVGITIPDVITDAEHGTMIPFKGIDSTLYDELNSNRTIYGTLNGTVDTYCHAYGLCFAALEPEATVAADISGDGIVNKDDAVTLARCSVEYEGMHMSDTAFEEADMNADDMLTIHDILLSILTVFE